jgi:hypothetical protein
MSFYYDEPNYNLVIDISGLNIPSIPIISISSYLYDYPITLSSYISYTSPNYLTLSSYTISSVAFSSNFTNANFNYFSMGISGIFSFNFLTASGYVPPTLPACTISDFIIDTSLYVDIGTSIINTNKNLNTLNYYFTPITISSSISGLINYTYYKSPFDTLSGYVYR